MKKDEQSNQKKLKICIIDDEELILKMYSLKLEKGGYAVINYDNPIIALKNIPIEMPDLILLDIMMPQMDGITLFKKIRENPKTKKIPIIFLTNLDDDENKKNAAEIGALYYLNKSQYLPKDVNLLVDEIFDVKNLMDSHK